MSYQALYRVWRSQTFETIVGQQAVTQTLKNAIEQHKTSHAYLFSGPRGTGKTSAAKIFAKAINCEHSQNGEPCNECASCLAITEGSCNDILEIDAASNNGVDEIRDIRDKVKYAPTQVKYKVYIIDEVHMLSTGAFNALLKTLEEPPENVIFILATTEPYKIPATIISRTQRFDFKRINVKDIVEHMKDILIQIEVEFEEEALYLIARSAEGGMRDALSILDQAISFSNGKVTIQAAAEVTGSLTDDILANYLELCFNQETEKAIEKMEEILDSGKDAGRFLENILLYCRDLLIAQQAPELLKQQKGVVSEELLQLAQNISTDRLYQAIQLLNETQKELRFSNHTTIYLEVLTVKLCTQLDVNQSNLSSNKATVVESSGVNENDFLELQQQFTLLKKELEELKESGVVATSSNSTNAVSYNSMNKKSTNKNNYRIPTEQVYQVLQEATKTDLSTIKNIWVDLLQMLPVTHRAMLKSTELVAASAKGVVITFDYEIVCQRASSDSELQKNVDKALMRLIQKQLQFVYIPKDSWVTIRQNFIKNVNSQEMDLKTDKSNDFVVHESEAESLDDNSVVTEALKIFGSEVVEVTDD